MKKFFITLMLLTIGWLAYGSDFVVTHRTPTGEIMSRVIDEEETDGFSTAAMRPKAPVFKEGEAPERITLHIKFEYPENLVPDYVSYSQVGYGYYAPYNGEDEVDLVIGKDAFGHNIITASFVSTDPLANPDDAYLVFLRVPEFIDGMELIVDANTICNSYDFEFLDPEGNPFKIRHQLYDPTTGETVIDGDGNIDGLDGEISVYDANGFEIWWNMFELINRSYTDGRPEKINDRIQTIHINPLPDDLAVIAGAMGMNGNDEIWMMKTVPGNVSGHYNNDLKQYAEQEFKICNTPYMFGEEMLINYSLFTAFNGYLGSEMSIYLDRKIDDEVSTNIIMCFPEASMQGINTVQCLGGFSTADSYNDPNTSISSQLFMPKAGEVMYQPLNITIGGYKNASFDIYTWLWGNESNDFNKQVNPFIPSNINRYKSVIGNNTPSLTSLILWNPEYGSVPEELFDMLIEIGIISFGYTGRNGEAMMVDALNASVVTEREEGLEKYMINNDNVLIDGKVPGYNNTVLGCMIETEDWIPPTLQALLFLNEDGDVTDRFNSAEEASMMFYAGDFQYADNEDYTEDMMIVQPLGEVKVEYAPYGSDEFAELSVSEVPEKFFMPGYGYCYEGSLASVDRKSENGWFDLRISLTDENGNYQTQVISPAFRIDSLSGIDAVNAIREDLQIVDGQVMSSSGNVVNVYNIDGREVRNDNLAPGVYVARSGATSMKIVVR